MGFQIAVTNLSLSALGRNLTIYLLEICKGKYFTRFLLVRYLL